MTQVYVYKDLKFQGNKILSFQVCEVLKFYIVKTKIFKSYEKNKQVQALLSKNENK